MLWRASRSIPRRQRPTIDARPNPGHFHCAGDTIPNTSGRARFSVDFRTVNVLDLLVGRGAPLVDVNCTGTAIRDFMNVADEHPFDEQTVVDLFGPPPADAILVFAAPGTDAHSTPS